ncbi:unnamed protein product, partial [Laminaria digitata]
MWTGRGMPPWRMLPELLGNLGLRPVRQGTTVAVGETWWVGTAPSARPLPMPTLTPTVLLMLSELRPPLGPDSSSSSSLLGPP